MDTRIFCEQFYSALNIPVARFSEGALVETFPPFGRAQIPAEILSALRGSAKNPSVFTAAAGVYGLVRVRDTHEEIVIGPCDGSGALPQYPLDRFLNLLAVLHAALNRETVSVSGHFNAEDTAASPDDLPDSSGALDDRREHGSYHFELQMLERLRRGQPEELMALLRNLANEPTIRIGVLASDPLRQEKNLLIGLVAVVGKVGAIEGGMDVEEAYRLIDLYTTECENATTVGEVRRLQYNMLVDFADRVANSRIPGHLSKDVADCIRFIRRHTAGRISIDDVADSIGRGRAYTTSRFREETGVTILDFITDCKMREAQSLLRHTSMPVAEISELLCFSDTSYFKKVFKSKCGMTPQEYRENG